MNTKKQTDHVLSTLLQATFLTSQLGTHPAVSSVVTVAPSPTAKSTLQLLRLELLDGGGGRALITSR